MPDEGTAHSAARRDGLARRRKAVGLTQEALAELLDVDRATVFRWERGEAEPLPSLRPKLARALRVSADGLEGLLAVPPPAGSDGTGIPRQLPASVAGFTGRAAELSTLASIFDDASAGGGAPGAVVISAIGGTAGVGKTALAIQWAHQTAGRFPDGQLYVNLRGYDPDRPVAPADALAGFLGALGVPGQNIPPEEAERAARYRSLLAGRRVLVVLDNASSAEQVRPLLPGSPGCAVLVTSRDSLAGLVARDGAARLELDLLPLADAVRLLRALIGDRAVSDPAATEALAQRCCRLPLAIRVAAELAIARPDTALSVLSGELSDQQQGRLDLLAASGDPRTAVREVFSWSYRHLDGEAARAFRLAALHPAADFDAYAIAALADMTLSQARPVLDTLARAHLFQQAGPGRYGMHDLLRAYARELAAARDGADAEAAALTRLFDYYLQAAGTAMDVLYPAERNRRPRVAPSAAPAPAFSDAGEARSWLDAERPTLTAVTRHAAERTWPGHATRIAATLYRYLEAGRHQAEATIIHTSARLAAEREGDRIAEATAMNALGIIDTQQGRYSQAADNLLRGRELFRQGGDRLGEARALNNIGSLQCRRGYYQQAVEFHEQALSAYRAIGDRLGEGRVLGNLGMTMAILERNQEAIRSLRQALDLSQEVGGAGAVECLALTTLAQVALAQGDGQQAEDLLQRSLAVSRARGFRLDEARALAGLGDVRRHQDDHESASRCLQEALAIVRELGDRPDEAFVRNGLGRVHLAAGRPGDARDDHGAALKIATECGDRLEQASACDGLGDACRALGDAGQARLHWEQALAMYTDMGLPQAARVRALLDETAPG